MMGDPLSGWADRYHRGGFRTQPGMCHQAEQLMWQSHLCAHREKKIGRAFSFSTKLSNIVLWGNEGWSLWDVWEMIWKLFGLVLHCSVSAPLLFQLLGPEVPASRVRRCRWPQQRRAYCSDSFRICCWGRQGRVWGPRLTLIARESWRLWLFKGSHCKVWLLKSSSLLGGKATRKGRTRTL